MKHIAILTNHYRRLLSVGVGAVLLTIASCSKENNGSDDQDWMQLNFPKRVITTEEASTETMLYNNSDYRNEVVYTITDAKGTHKESDSYTYSYEYKTIDGLSHYYDEPHYERIKTWRATFVNGKIHTMNIDYSYRKHPIYIFEDERKVIDYDPQGRLTSFLITKEYRKDSLDSKANSKSDAFYTLSYTSPTEAQLYMSKDKTASSTLFKRFTFDGEGNLLRETFFDAQGSEAGYAVYTYAKHTNPLYDSRIAALYATERYLNYDVKWQATRPLLSEERYFADGTLQKQLNTVYTTDSQGRITEAKTTLKERKSAADAWKERKITTLYEY